VWSSILGFKGHTEPAPTSAPMWMDGALMGVPFSSLSVPGLTRVANSGWWPYSYFWEHFFFLIPQVPPTYLPTFRLPPYAPWPTLSPTYLLTYLPTYPIICLSTYLCAYTLNFHQGNDHANQWGYCHIPSRLLRCPFHVFNRPHNFVIVKKQCDNDSNENIAIKLDFSL
jgi:hypothetical protein